MQEIKQKCMEQSKENKRISMHLINIRSHLAETNDRDDIQKATFVDVALVFCMYDITSNLNTKAQDLELLVRDWLNLLKERAKKLKHPRTIPASET